MNSISSFSGPHRFMSNFYPVPVQIYRRPRSHTYPTAEHAFQALKTDSEHWQRLIADAPTAAEAKRLGRQAPLRSNWEIYKFDVMQMVVKEKFRNEELAAKLVETGTVLLVEGNIWHDQTWGDCICPEHRDIPGCNALGIILMRVRLNCASRTQSVQDTRRQ